ncbi:MAG: hypothetical protein N3D11_06275 [Candidatus Sumerlaeia bacterium]|nr:hypothetical protein [Candidatus Sumerlaeia bacterium]
MRFDRRILPIAGLATVLSVLSQPVWAAAANPSRESREAGEWTAGLLLAVVLWLLLKAALAAFSVCAAQVWPQLIRRGRGILVASPVKSGLMGLVNVALAIFIGAALMKVKAAALLGFLLLVFTLFVVASARALFYQVIGTRLTDEVVGPEGNASVRAHCLGALASELAFLVPIVGWLAECLAVLASVGAVILAAMSGRQPEPKPESSPGKRTKAAGSE